MLEHFEEQYNSTAGEKTEFVATNLTSTEIYGSKDTGRHRKVSPEKAALLETRVIDGRSYLLIQIDDAIEVNGVPVQAIRAPEQDD